MKKTLMLIGILSILASNANAWVAVTVTDSGGVVRVTDWCGWGGLGKTYYDKNWYLEQQIK